MPSSPMGIRNQLNELYSPMTGGWKQAHPLSPHLSAPVPSRTLRTQVQVLVPSGPPGRSPPFSHLLSGLHNTHLHLKRSSPFCSGKSPGSPQEDVNYCEPLSQSEEGRKEGLPGRSRARVHPLAPESRQAGPWLCWDRSRPEQSARARDPGRWRAGGAGLKGGSGRLGHWPPEERDLTAQDAVVCKVSTCPFEAVAPWIKWGRCPRTGDRPLMTCLDRGLSRHLDPALPQSLWTLGGGRQDGPLMQGLLCLRGSGDLLSASLLGARSTLPSCGHMAQSHRWGFWVDEEGTSAGWWEGPQALQRLEGSGRDPEGWEDKGELGSRARSPSAVYPGPWGSSSGG